MINAINQDMPFDQFTIEQIAGDLLPDATIDQKIATGFHRTPTCNVEAGVHPEENRVNQVGGPSKCHRHHLAGDHHGMCPVP